MFVHPIPFLTVLLWVVILVLVGIIIIPLLASIISIFFLCDVLFFTCLRVIP
jgi:hypothetical protein